MARSRRNVPVETEEEPMPFVIRDDAPPPNTRRPKSLEELARNLTIARQVARDAELAKRDADEHLEQSQADLVDAERAIKEAIGV
jgi:hypothetical protein